MGYRFSFQRRWVYVASKTSLPRLFGFGLEHLSTGPQLD